MRRLLSFFVLFLIGCAYQAPYVIKEPPSAPPPVVEKQPPTGVVKEPPPVMERQPPLVTEKVPPPPTWGPSPTQLYGDPSRGFVQNLTDNKVVRGWWTFSRVEKKPVQPPDFELWPGFIQEFHLSPGKHWLYVEGVYFTQRGENPAGWNTFQIGVTSRIYYDGHYGWRVIIYDGHFRY